MALELIQQFEQLLFKSKNVLIVIPENPDGDAIMSARALYFFLEKKEIIPVIAFSDSSKNEEKFNFLLRPERVSNNISGTCDFILSFKTLHNKIIDVKSEYLPDEVRVHITPERGSIDPRDFSFIPAHYKFELIVFLGSPDKESSGKIFEKNPDIFYEVPIVNVDYHSNNENFGQLNLVFLTASSVAEIIFELFEKIEEKNIDEVIANCLLAGIISATESFQRKNTTPKAMQIAAKLMDKGADQQHIIRWLYKTQPLHILKLWGRVMARLNWDEELKIVWSLVSIEDFVQSRSSIQDIPLILEKIKENYSTGKIFLILYNEKKDVVAGMIKCIQPEMVKNIVGAIGGEAKQDMVEFRMEGKNIVEVEEEILKKLKMIAW